MQANSTGSIISLECIDDCFFATWYENEIQETECTIDCLKTSFTYDQGHVSDIGAGYNDIEHVKTGSFLMASGIGNVLISNITFSFNFAFNNLRSPNKGYIINSKNHLGIIKIEDCEFYSNYVNYLIYIDVSSLVYTDKRVYNIMCIDHFQQHFFMNNITITSTYCSKGVVYYLMENLANNIKITNLSINKSVVGEDGILIFLKNGELKESDVNGVYDKIDLYISQENREI